MIRETVILEIEITKSLQEQLEKFSSDYGIDKEYIIARALPTYFNTVNH